LKKKIFMLGNYAWFREILHMWTSLCYVKMHVVSGLECWKWLRVTIFHMCLCTLVKGIGYDWLCIANISKWTKSNGWSYF
jgi:hypothetical protein